MLTVGVRIIGKNTKRLPATFRLAMAIASIGLKEVFLKAFRKNTPIDTGALQAAWSSVSASASGLTFRNPMSYAETVNSGLYTSVGPRTVRTDNGIFSQQAPEGMVKPLASDIQLKKDIVSIIQGAMARM